MITTTGSVLDDIIAYNRTRLRAVKRREPSAALQARIRDLPPSKDFAAALKGPRISIIAEVKKASPSAGLLRPRMNPVTLAREYAVGGAAAISVLTERKFFQGDLKYLSRIRTALGKRQRHPPLLRKDFIFDAYQVYQARAYGADALLLIVAVLDDPTLHRLLTLTRRLGMEALVEVHDEAETRRALDSGARVIGVNNRDLRDFKVDLGTTYRLRDLIPRDRVVVSESGIKGTEDIHRLREHGVDAVLIGESLVTAPSAKAKLRELRS